MKFSRTGGVIEFSVHLTNSDGDEVETRSAQLAKMSLSSNNSFDPEEAPCLVAKRQKILQSKNTDFRLKFQVKDYGVGIDKNDQDRIFRPFLQAKRNKAENSGGTGLGLAITAKLIESMGGSICVESNPGEFSLFVFDLPCESEPADVDHIAQKLSKCRLLLVLDDVECPSEALFEHFSVDFKRLSTCVDLTSAAMEAQQEGKRCLCMIQEDKFDVTVYEKLVETVGVALVTVGSQHSVRGSRWHIRSTRTTLPSYLFGKFVEALEDSRETKTEKSSDQAAQSFSSIHVLIAEDNKVNQKVLNRMLLKVGFVDIDVVENGSQAVEACGSKKYDIVLMDMQMPVMGGLEACRLIVEKRGNAISPKVIFVTANATDDYEQHAKDSGGDGFISKPFNLVKIVSFFESFPFS